MHSAEGDPDVVERAIAQAGGERALGVHGRRVQLFEGGTGRPLLYLHGAGTFWWMPVHDLLAARCRVLLPVHPGFGSSEGLDAIETIEDLVFHTLDVLDTLGLDRVDVVGLSLGGWLGAELALRHPARVNRLVLVDAAGVRVPGVPMGNPFMLPPPKVRELMFHDPAIARRQGTPPRHAASRAARDGAARARSGRPATVESRPSSTGSSRAGSGASPRRRSSCGAARTG